MIAQDAAVRNSGRGPAGRQCFTSSSAVGICSAMAA